MSAEDLPEVLRVEHFISDCRTLDESAFREKHGDAFLVHFGAIEGLRRPEKPQRTMVFKDETPFFEGKNLRTLRSDYLIYPVRSTGRSPYPRMITVGRTRNNDIVLPDESVSKFHAFFRDADEQDASKSLGLRVQDAGSRNGTALNGIRVPTAKQGSAMALTLGDKLRFGLVQVTFLDAPGLRQLASFTSR
jgi:hypothetical protein